MNKIKWNKELDNQLIELYKENNVSKIAEIMGLRKSQVENHCRTLKLYKPNEYIHQNQWSEWENKIILKNFKEMSYTDLYQLLPHRSIDGIKRQCSKLGLRKEVNYWSNEEINLLKSVWSNHKKKEIQKIFNNRSWASLRTQADILNLQKQRKGCMYNVNENFFKQLTSESAYVLGFIYADGYIRKDANILQIAIKDLDLLEEIKKTMESEHPIKKVDKPEINSYIYFLCIGSKKIIYDLNILGVVTKKSKIIEFPNLPDELMPHFIRGYFDGDGCICKNRKSKSAIFTTGSYNFIKSISDFLFKKVEIKISKISNNGKNAFNYNIYGENADKLFHWMYKDATIYLKRKYDRFIQYGCSDILNQNTSLENVGCF